MIDLNAMSDDEIVRLAGIAAHIKKQPHDSEQLPEYIWDPLNDVWDAMGLAVDLHMDILFGVGGAPLGGVGVEATIRDESIFVAYVEGVDERITTCRAITLLAASRVEKLI